MMEGHKTVLHYLCNSSASVALFHQKFKNVPDTATEISTISPNFIYFFSTNLLNFPSSICYLFFAQEIYSFFIDYFFIVHTNSSACIPLNILFTFLLTWLNAPNIYHRSYKVRNENNFFLSPS